MLFSDIISQTEPYTAYLQFNIVPDEVNIRCWPEACWNKDAFEAESGDIEVVYNAEKDLYELKIKDGNYIYEIHAKWNSAEKYSGSAYYSFFTVIGGIAAPVVE